METVAFFRQRPSGSGDGSGYGSGIKTVSGHSVEYIDGIPTIITTIKGDLAKGYIVDPADFSKKPCYVARSGYAFAHGDTARKAAKALEEKLLAEMSVDERIAEFIKAGFKLDSEYPVKTFFYWHGRLTGSCENGRLAFAKTNGLDVESGTMTTRQFIQITKNAFGGEVISRIEPMLK